MKSKLEKFAEVTTSLLNGVDQIVKTCKEGENSINKRNNQLSVSVSFAFGEGKDGKQNTIKFETNNDKKRKKKP